MLDAGLEGAEQQVATPFPGVLPDPLGPAWLCGHCSVQIARVLATNIHFVYQRVDLLDAQPTAGLAASGHRHASHYLASAQAQASDRQLSQAYPAQGQRLPALYRVADDAL
ncbi:hypothetical protein D3C80_1333220 [compost metagenome]